MHEHFQYNGDSLQEYSALGVHAKQQRTEEREL